MSTSTSSAQGLPLHVLRLILGYAAPQYKTPYNKYAGPTATTKELLSVCHSWRQAALEHLWRTIQLTIDDQRGTVFIDHPGWAKNFMFPHNAQDLVEEIIVSVSIESIVTGNAFNLLSSYIKRMPGLPQASSLLVVVSYSKIGPGTTQTTRTKCTLDFAQLLKSMTCKGSTIAKVKCIGTYMFDKLVEENFGMFVRTVTNGNRSKAGLCLGGIRFDKCIDSLPQLSSLKMHIQLSRNLSSSILFRCANSLVELDVNVSDNESLLQSGDGQTVVYPNVKHLIMRSTYYHFSVKKELTANIVPFPKLERLEMYMQYPYSDDVLFRGNHASLKYLRFPLHDTTVKFLHEHQAFRFKNSALTQVVIDEAEDNKSILLASDGSMDMLLAKLLSSVCILKVSSSKMVQHVIAAAMLGRGFENIKVLNAGWIKLTLTEVLSLLKVLPALTHLTSVIGGQGVGIDDNIGSSSTAENTLKKWTAYLGKDVGKYAAALYILQVAIECPRLAQVHVQHSSAQEINENIAEMLESRPYIRDSPYFKNLLM